jgi:glycosyltransferase involved in cell wall biosynthesis
VNVAVVNLFDPLPGESLREGRYGAICRALVERGHRVHWYSSDFSHAFKQPRDAAIIAAAAERLGYEVTLVSSRLYTENVSLARLRSHLGTARRLHEMWASEPGRPDAILVSLPPPAIGRAAAEWSRSTGAALVVDVQDLWPETFVRFWPRGLGWLNGLVFAGMVRDVLATYRQASAVMGAARGYVEHAARWVRPGTPTAVMPLGVDLAAFDTAVRPLAETGQTKAPGEKWVLLGGTLSAYVAWPAMLNLADELRRRGRADVRLVVVGSGPAEALMRREAARRGLTNVTFLGQQPYGVFASVATASDVALAPMRPDAQVFFPNRVFDYFAAGLPVVSTIGGELADVLARHGAGLTCPAVTGAALADAVEAVLGRGPIGSDYRRRRSEWVRQYDRAHIAAEFVTFVEDAARRRQRESRNHA